MSIIEKAAGKLGKPGAGQPGGDAARFEPALAPSEQPASTFAPAAPPRTGSGSSSRLQKIDLDLLKRSGMITPDDGRSQIAEEFRLIKRPLLVNALGQGAAPIEHGNLIMVTSSLPGEGKSFCAINLAMSIATERDRTVLLVDADVAKPRVLDYLGLKAEQGLLDLLLDPNLSLSDVLIKTDIEKFSVLPAGKTYKHATELLASEAMNRLIGDIATRYPDRIIIFDSPPLLSTSEASVLASHMGQIVMVVEAESTPQEAFKEALSMLESCEVVATLLNKAAPRSGGDYYYGNYGSYGSYGK